MNEDVPVTQLFAALKMGDESAARRIFELYRQRVAGIARKILPNRADPADVSDVVQSVFAAVFVQARAGKLDPSPRRLGVVHRESLRQYLLTVACHNSIRKSIRLARAPVNTLELEAIIAQRSDQEIQVDIRDVIEHLKLRLEQDDPVALQILELILTTSLTQSQIADQLNCSISNVERKLQKIRAIFKEELSQE